MSGASLDLALVHYPVCNKNGEIIGSAVTNLDVHDLARTGRTYGINRLYLVTPYEDQQQLVRELLDHWLIGRGGAYNRKRKEALELVAICPDLASLYQRVTAERGRRPLVVATSAKAGPRTMNYQELRQRLAIGEPALLLLGTGWGLAPAALEETDVFLPPLSGAGDYNHLPVRAAAAIILDRLLSGEVR